MPPIIHHISVISPSPAHLQYFCWALTPALNTGTDTATFCLKPAYESVASRLEKFQPLARIQGHCFIILPSITVECPSLDDLTTVVIHQLEQAATRPLPEDMMQRAQSCDFFLKSYAEALWREAHRVAMSILDVHAIEPHLAACAVCGSKGYHDSKNGRYHRIACPCCGRSTGTFPTKLSAFVTWANIN